MKMVDGADSDAWSTLIIESQDGNRDSYRKLLELVYELGQKFLKRHLFQTEVIDEILQESVLAVHRGLASYDRSYSGKGWVYSVIKNKLVDHFRKSGREKVEAVESDMLIAFSDPGGLGQENLNAHQWLTQSLAVMPENQRVVFTMIQIEGLENNEVANKTGMTPSNVKVLLHRARSFLKARYFSEGN